MRKVIEKKFWRDQVFEFVLDGEDGVILLVDGKEVQWGLLSGSWWLMATNYVYDVVVSPARAGFDSALYGALSNSYREAKSLL